MKNNTKLFVFLVIFLFVAIGCDRGRVADTPTDELVDPIIIYDIPITTLGESDILVASGMQDNPVSVDLGMEEMNSKGVSGVEFRYKGNLKDVSSGSATGIAMQDYKFGNYMFHAKFQDLPLLQNGDFYEGWVVRREPFHFISTGKIVEVNRELVNTYLSSDNLLEHDFYVLTLEPDDNDPSPATHILEGVMNPED